MAASEFFARLREAAGAGLAPAARRHQFSVAGRPVSVAASPTLELPLTRAFHHLGQAPAGAGLSVLAWDAASTGVSAPPLPWTQHAEKARGVVDGYDTDGFVTVVDRFARTLTMFDEAAGEAVIWVSDAAAISPTEWASPLRNVLHWWLAGSGLQVTHGGVVGLGGRGVLLAGRGGAGKSTTAVSCLLDGFDYLADDYFALDPGGPRAHSLYSTAKLDGDSRRLLSGAAAEQPAPAPDGKTVTYLQDSFAERLVLQFDLVGVVLPEVRPGQATRLERIGGAPGLAAVGPSTVLQLPGAGAAAFSRIARALAALPPHRLVLGDDAHRAPALLRELLA